MVIQRPNNPGIPSEHEMAVFGVMAKHAVESRMYKGVGDQSAVMMIMLAARELAIPPMQALNGGIHIIEGKVEISARMLTAMIRRAGHSIKIIHTSDEKCVLQGTRSDNGDTVTVSFSVEDAQKAGLVKEKGGWKKCPKDMCYARAASRLARQLFSDVIGIGYVEGEIKAVDTVPQIEEQTAEPLDPDSLALSYYSMLEETNTELASRYVRVVMNHFKWTDIETYEELLKDPTKTREQYSKWKAKLAVTGAPS